ncbi:tripartite tricarboxylate transporter family receptor domain-containing protein [Ditylenchus destructor]|uniref:Tripartite tricarboxylate transporter family receptor domain-containing protein n=1 Tax=Ditylenchus destructor TaxID=166010 RepID=A0AAD4QT86_9BILA|nr:tripartite tricarboxylate transporter family receptor domain-containing protein [Ditylenchus destructor]
MIDRKFSRRWPCWPPPSACSQARPPPGPRGPRGPITFVVPSAAGGSPDVLSRLVTNEVSKSLGVPVVIENRPGAAGNIGILQIKSKPADGYTIGYGNVNTLAVNRTLFKKLALRRGPRPGAGGPGLRPLQRADRAQGVAHPRRCRGWWPQRASSRASCPSAHRHRYHRPHGRRAAAQHGRIDVLFVPYNGGPAALQDLMGGRIDYLFANSSEVGPLVASGKVRALAVSSTRRIAMLPNVPTLDEAGIKGYGDRGLGRRGRTARHAREVIEKSMPRSTPRWPPPACARASPSWAPCRPAARPPTSSAPSTARPGAGAS